MNSLWSSGGAVAVLAMDYQNALIEQYPAAQAALPRVREVLDAARSSGVLVGHIVVRFRDGHPEVSSNNKIFSAIKRAGGLLERSPASQIHKEVSPLDSEPVITKRRVSALSTSELEHILRAHDVRHLILMGLTTSGVVLSTVRAAADLDYSIVVVSDACADGDDTVHEFLMEKIFPRQATVATAQEAANALRSGRTAPPGS